MKLFDLIEGEVQVAPQTLLLKPFKAIYSRDKSKDKMLAKKELAFIYFYVDMRSDYKIIIDEKERLKEIKAYLMLPEKWKIDKKLQEAIDFYKEKSYSVIKHLYDGAVIAVMAVDNELRNAEELMKITDKSGKPVYDLSKITSAISKVPQLMKNLKAAEQEIIKEEQSTSKKTGSKEHNIFEDGL